MYIYHNTTNNNITAFTTIKAVSVHLGINYDTLLYCFSRKKLNEYKQDNIRIIKVDPIKLKRK